MSNYIFFNLNLYTAFYKESIIFSYIKEIQCFFGMTLQDSCLYLTAECLLRYHWSNFTGPKIWKDQGRLNELMVLACKYNIASKFFIERILLVQLIRLLQTFALKSITEDKWPYPDKALQLLASM